ncbi:MAG TPA: hypothetical protein VGA01_19535 [Candidatus Binatia bacterium]
MGGLPTSRTVNGFAIDPENSKTMFVAMRDSLFKSTDAGVSWKVVGSEVKNPAAVTINPKNVSEVIVATVDGTVYVSADAGMNWGKQR